MPSVSEYRLFELIQAAIDANPLNGRLWILLGGMQRLMGDSVRELECFQKAVEIDYGRDSWIELAKALQDAGTEESRNAIDTAVRLCAARILFCGCASDYIALGQAMNMKGDVYESVEAFKIATQKDESQERAWYHLGRIYLSHGEIDLAIPALLKAVSLEKHCVHSLCALTQAYRQKGNMDSATKFAKECLKLDKNCGGSWEVLVAWLKKEGKAKELKETIKTLERVSQNSKNINLLFSLGCIFA